MSSGITWLILYLTCLLLTAFSGGYLAGRFLPPEPPFLAAFWAPPAQHGSPTPLAPDAPAGNVSADSNSNELARRSSLGPPADPVLVVYVFAATDSMSRGNLAFFLDQAVAEGDGVQYVIVVNLGPKDTLPELRLPRLPGNAVYVPRNNSCYDWGTYAWALAHVKQADPKRYKYFIFLNSSARGPFLQPTFRGKVHWSRLFVDAIDETTKLVGPTISCGGFCYTRPGKQQQQQQCLKHPHIQSVAIGMDHVGLKVLNDTGRVLKCHQDRDSAVFDAEIGASVAVIAAGYNIASFLSRYDGIDFRRPENHGCNGRSSPLGIHSFDGLTPGAFELVFPKVKQSLVESRLATHIEAMKLSEWIMMPPEKRPIDTNAANRHQQLVEDVLVASNKGIKCFDMPFYRRKNPALATRIPNDRDLFIHFLAQGLADHREHRWKCGLDAHKIIPKWP